MCTQWLDVRVPRPDHLVLFRQLWRAISTPAAAKSLQSCPTLCDPMDCSLPGSSAHGIFQARTLEWGASSFSNAWKWKVKVKSLSRVQLLATPWTAAYQAPPPMGFSRQEYWRGSPPVPSPISTPEFPKASPLVSAAAQQSSHSSFHTHFLHSLTDISKSVSW